MGLRADIKPLPSLGRLNELFTYDAETGDLCWKSIPANFRRAKVGDVAGTIGQKGYRVIGVDRQYYLAHRIIWKMVTGEDPADQIDHIDNDRLNNRWANFRPASNGQNRWNTKLSKNNKSGIKGVCWDANHKSWAAYITDGRHKRLGRFKNIEDAADVRREAAEKLHGEFLRLA